MVGIALTGIGLFLLVAWWLVWTGRWTLRPDTPRTTRLLMGAWPGVAVMVVAIGVAAAGDAAAPGDENPADLAAGIVLLLGLVTTALGVGWALLALVRTPRRFDVEWLRTGSAARAKAARAEAQLPRDRRFMVAAGVIFSATSLAIIINGLTTSDEGTLWLGLVGLVFFGGGALVFLRVTTQRRQFAPPEVRTLPGTDERGMVFRASRGSIAVFAAGASVFVAAGIAFIAEPSVWIRPRFLSDDVAFQTVVRLVGIAAVAFFGFGLVHMIRDLIRPFGLALTPHRLIYRAGMGRRSLRWDDIADVTPGNHAYQPMLGLRLTDPAALGTRWPLARLQRRWYGCDVWIALRNLRGDPAVITAAVTHLVDHPQERAYVGEPGADGMLEALTGGSGR